MSTILSGLSTIGLKSATGGVTQADVDAAFAADSVKAVPADAQPVLEAMQQISGKLVGKTQTDAATLLGEWTTPFEKFTNATMTVCS